MIAPSLDKNKNNCINYDCGNGMAFRGIVPEGNVKRTIHARMMCKRWSCKTCGPKQAWLLQQRIAAKAKELGLFRMLTLTLDPKKVRGDPYKHLNESWRKLREAFRRKFKKSISFIAINEYQKNGMPHKHILVDRYIHQEWVKNKWEKLGGGHQVDIRKIKNEDDPAKYICKYLTKDVLINAPKGRKRVTTSRDIKLREKASKGDWTLVEAELDDIYERRKDQLAAVVTDKHGRVMSIEEHERIDFQVFEVSNGWPQPMAGPEILPPELENYGLIRWFAGLTTLEEAINEEDRRDLRESIEQGTAAGRILHLCSIEALGGICQGTGIPGLGGIPGCGNSKAGWPASLWRYAVLLEGVA